ncbi:MAG: hypothetical protein JWO11_4058 [Nocardioides sp.]|nr:hypothetical protein [Nocardioides sp.]
MPGRYSQGVARPPSFSPALGAALATLVAALAMVVGTGSAASARVAVIDGGTIAAKVPVAAPRPARSRPADAPPLSVTIDSLSPSYIPKHGVIRVTGSVTNNDAATWSSINVYPFASATPMTTEAELVDAAASDPALPVGNRVTARGYYDTINKLAPGGSEQFSVKVPRSALVTANGVPLQEPGVYWFGIHALGQGDEGRDTNADGRARTFLPLVPNGIHRSMDTALVIPLRRNVKYAGTGTLEHVGDWTRTLSPEGKLRSLVDFGAAAGSRPVTWLLDPALPDAVRQLVAGNPARYLGPTVTDGSNSSDSASPSATTGPAPSASPTESGGANAPQTDPALVSAVEAGTAWLDRLHEALGQSQSQILALPYGDLDVAAAAEHEPGLIDRAKTRSGSILEPWGLRMSPAVASPTGYLDAAGIQAVGPDTTVLATDRMFGADPPGVAGTAGHKLVVTSSGAASGGPGPGNRMSTVSLRQRILSEAAVRLLHPGGGPLVVVLPSSWTPRDSSGFFEGLDVDWIHLMSVANATARTPTPFDIGKLDYPRRQADRELDAANFSAVEALIRAGDALQNVLTRNDRIASVVTDQALTAASYASRAHPDAARVRTDRSRQWIDDQLSLIDISAPRGVTLSGSSGKFATTITNGLDQPVTVRIEAQTPGDRVQIRGPVRVPVPANGRTTVLLTADTTFPGVHNVRLVLTDCPEDPADPTNCKGLVTPIGSTDELSIRSAQVSKVIWLIIGTGAAMLFGAILVRLVRRVRRARRSPPDPDPATEIDRELTR